jgi:hypothetical protein
MHDEIGDLVVYRNETLKVTRRLEAAHHLLVHPRWLVRVFRPVVQPLVLAVFDVQTEVPVWRRIAFELVGDQHPRRTSMLPEQLAHQALGRVPVAPALHQHVKHRAMLVHRGPQPMLLSR